MPVPSMEGNAFRSGFAPNSVVVCDEAALHSRPRHLGKSQSQLDGKTPTHRLISCNEIAE